MTIAAYHKTRIAPTPSGFLHLGNILSFAITATLAKKHGAKILLRIDDLDQARVNEAYLQDIFETLHFLDIPWDEGPRNVKDFEASYSQLQRMALYDVALQQLADERLVFACTCSRGVLATNSCNCKKKQIPLNTENVSWRLISELHNEVSVKTYGGQTITSRLPAEMQNFIVKKKDGFPAYQLTSMIDDLFYDVDLIVRGEDLWPSTLAQHALALALGKHDFGEMAFYHHPLIMDENGQKLSKSAGSTSVKYLRESEKKANDVYMLIASLRGIDGNINDWEHLAGIIKDWT